MDEQLLNPIIPMISDRAGGHIFTPEKIAVEMVNMLFDSFKDINENTTFLDPACKAGIFLLVIYDKLMKHPRLTEVYPDEQQRSNHILSKQLFGIALDDFTQLISMRSLYGSITADYNNIKVIENYISKVKDKDSLPLQKALKERFGTVKFDVVIGNPPYQEDTGGGGRGNLAVDIFDKFIIKGVFLSKHFISMITPSKWINKNNLKEIKCLMSSGHLQEIVTFSNSNLCFPGADIAGGVSYFLYDLLYSYENCQTTNISKNRKHTCIRPLFLNGNLVIDNMAYSILKHLGDFKKFEPASGDNPFGILSSARGGVLQESQDDYILVRDGIEEYFNANEIRNHLLADKFKITIGKMNPDRGGVNNSSAWNVINVPKALPPKYIIPQNFMVLFASNEKMEASRFYMYSKTKFFRFLALQGLSGASLSTKDTWRFIPLQDFTSNLDIDWSQSIADIDKQLYKKYNLTQEEIDYIEATIKPMA